LRRYPTHNTGRTVLHTLRVTKLLRLLELPWFRILTVFMATTQFLQMIGLLLNSLSNKQALPVWLAVLLQCLPWLIKKGLLIFHKSSREDFIGLDKSITTIWTESMLPSNTRSKWLQRRRQMWILRKLMLLVTWPTITMISSFVLKIREVTLLMLSTERRSKSLICSLELIMTKKIWPMWWMQWELTGSPAFKLTKP